jgi:NhaP-type Na+/H+ and K+/H+ antiporter
MFVVDQLLLLGAVLLLIGIASSKFSSQVGLPVLVLFLAVGMLAGSDGIGGIHFDNYTLAHGIGTLCLAMSSCSTAASGRRAGRSVRCSARRLHSPRLAYF